MTAINPFDFFVEPYAEKYPFTYDPVLAKELIPYLETLPAGPKLQSLIADFRRDKVRTNDYLVEINQRLQRDDQVRHPHGAGRADAARRR